MDTLVDNFTYGYFVAGLFLANNFLFVGKREYVNLVGRLGNGVGKNDAANDQRNYVTRGLWILTCVIIALATFLIFRSTVLEPTFPEVTFRLGYILWASLLGPFLFFFMAWPHVFFSWLDPNEESLSRKNSVVSSASAWAGIVLFCLSFVIYTTMVVLAWIFLRIGTAGGWAALALYSLGWLTFIGFGIMILWSFRTMAKRGANSAVKYIKEEATKRQKQLFGRGSGGRSSSFGSVARSNGWKGASGCK